MSSTETATGESKRPDSWISRQNAGLWAGLAFLAFSAVFFWMSFDLSYKSRLGAGPGMYPRWLCGLSIVVALAYIWQSCTTQVFRIGDHFPGRRELANVAAIFVSCVVFLLLLNHVGFIVAGTALMFITFWRNYRLWQAAALSVVITLTTWVVFKIFFSVPLP
jgi:putative tricarboxylic transport membrane protein